MLDEAIRAFCGRGRAVIGCCVSTILSLILNSGEIWIALWALNLHATVVNAIILQSMALTIRSVAFPVPGGLGVQESGYVLVGNLLGIPGDTAFALSLIARVRELALGIPGLICRERVRALSRSKIERKPYLLVFQEDYRPGRSRSPARQVLPGPETPPTESLAPCFAG